MKFIWRFFGRIYLSDRFFLLFGLVIVVFIISFFLPWLFSIALMSLVGAGALLIVDGLMLYAGGQRYEAQRKLPNALSLGDPNRVQLTIINHGRLEFSVTIIDELPPQLQVRDFKMTTTLKAGEKTLPFYTVTPNERGEYWFGALNLYSRTVIGLFNRRDKFDFKAMVPVYPSFIQMKKFELMAFAKISAFQGIKKIRRIGHSYEFEQIKNYVVGDDFRSINWKATSKRNELMVNQYEDERSQQIYSVIDKSRSMKMPFGGLSLLDHSINTSLVISNIAIHKHDKAGLLTFSDKIGTTLKAERSPVQLKKIMESLYHEQERKHEANYELLYYAVRNFIKGRSLLLLYTNFESLYALQRVLPILRRINRQHLLVVIFFENTEIKDFSRSDPDNVEGVYYQTIAEQFVQEKKQIVDELRKHQIQSVLTRPEELSLNTINKYLELKSKGLI